MSWKLFNTMLMVQSVAAKKEGVSTVCACCACPGSTINKGVGGRDKRREWQYHTECYLIVADSVVVRVLYLVFRLVV